MEKIAFIITGTNHISGISTATTMIANELAENKNFEVSLITLTDRSNVKFVSVNKKINVIKIFEKNVNLKKNMFRIIYKLKQTFKINNFDYIVVPTLIFHVAYIANKSKAKLVSWDHASIPLEESKASIQYFVRRLSTKKAESIVVITKAAKSVYQDRYPNNNNFVQIYNTTDNLSFKNKAYNNSSKLILSVGSLDYIKGFDIAIKVASIVFKKNPEWEWHIYGEGKEKEKLSEMIKSYGLEDNVKLRGYSENIMSVYNKYSFFVLSSRSESFGMVILEAQKNNLPVISFNCSYGPNELILNGRNGFLIEPFNIEEMASKIEILISKPSIRKKMSEESSVLSANMDKKVVIEKWEYLFNEIKLSLNHKEEI